MSIEEKLDQAKGSVKEGVGKLTGDEQGSGSFQVHFVALPFVFLGAILISVPILAVVAAKLKTRAKLRRLKQKYS